MDLIVSHDGTRWHAAFGAQTWRCAIGRSGVTRNKAEGHGATPVGRFPLRRVLYRADRVPAPDTALPTAEIDPDDGWCDDPEDAAYNRAVRLPYPARHERMWRGDGLYDVVVVMGHNDDPPQPGLGSAIFLHVAWPDYGPTEGCVALAKPDLLTFLRTADSTAHVRVEDLSPLSFGGK